ncbi:MAG: class I SAM-dependent methyltransferase [Acidimicrobiia bacterium]|nr:class I SAM-dependent methyltransferase [Acidimicrobiia bacterium]
MHDEVSGADAGRPSTGGVPNDTTSGASGEPTPSPADGAGVEDHLTVGAGERSPGTVMPAHGVVASPAPGQSEPTAAGSDPSPLPPAVIAGLERARSLGFFGPGPLDGQLEVANRFAAALRMLPRPERALDLGSGGGLPGFALVMEDSTSEWFLLDAMARRTTVLDEVVVDAGLEERVTVVTARAEDAAHDPALRESFDVVVSRSFGAPAVVAECATALLRHGGHLLVSEPPDAGATTDERRWPPAELAALGLRSLDTRHGIHVMIKDGPTPADLPRRSGVPKKRPLWTS